MQGQPARSSGMGGDVAWVQHTTPGLHISANRSRANPHSHSNVSAAGLRLIVALQGPLQLRFDQQDFRLQPQHQAQVLLVNLNEQALFQRHCGQPGVELKVCMALDHPWLERHGLAEAGKQSTLARLARGHLAARQWTASAPLSQLAQQMVQHHAANPLLTQIEREGMGMLLLGQVLEALGDTPANSSATPQLNRHLQRVKDLIDSGEGENWSLHQLADAACMSSSTLQRHFRRHFNCSVMDYLRGQRLESARQLLLSGQHRITDVALGAGYSSAANFATAFRRRFGQPPSACLR